MTDSPGAGKAPLRGALVVGAPTDADLAASLDRAAENAISVAPPPAPPDDADLTAPVRVAIDYGDAAELVDAARRAVAALRSPRPAPAVWRLLRNRGVYLGRGPARPIAFLYPGQGSQYVGMFADLRAADPIVTETFAEADRLMAPVLGRPLTDHLFATSDEQDAIEQAEQLLLLTDVAQPAMLTSNWAVTRLLAAFGVRPDMVMGHSLGEFSSLLAAGSFTLGGVFEAAIEGVRARLERMTGVLGDDPGAMAAVMAPMAEIERIVDAVGGYLVVANRNSNAQAVVAGASAAVATAAKVFADAGYTVVRLPVSHAFHTPVTPAYETLKKTLVHLGFRPPVVPMVANATGEFYPTDGPRVLEDSLDLACREIDEPVQFVKGLHTLYDAGARVFVEVGPKKVLHGFTEDVLGSYDDVLVLFTNHPKVGDLVAFNRALCGLYAEGHGRADRRN